MAASRISTLLEYMEDDPDDAFTQFALAREYLKVGDVEKALSYYEKLAEEQPRYVGTYFHLGKLYEKMGRKEEAIETFRAGAKVALEEGDAHARAELQDALLAAEGIGFDD